MSIKIERKEWNNSDTSEDEALNSLETTRDVVIEEIISDGEKSYIVDTCKKSSSEADTTLNENMLSDNLAESLKSELLDKSEYKQISDTESIPSIDTNILNTHLISSTPQPQSEEEDCFSYKQLIIPQETKYIELILCCNKDPVTSFAQLAENNDDIFPKVNICEFIVK